MRGTFTCDGWTVTLCDPIWQVTSRSCVCETGVLCEPAMHTFNLFFIETGALCGRKKINCLLNLTSINVPEADEKIMLPVGQFIPVDRQCQLLYGSDSYYCAVCYLSLTLTHSSYFSQLISGRPICFTVQSSAFTHSNSGSKAHKTTHNDIKAYTNIKTDRQTDRGKLYKRVLDRIQRMLTQSRKCIAILLVHEVHKRV